MVALAASFLGSIGGAALVESAIFTTEEQELTNSEYSLEYSIWAQNQDMMEFEADVKTPWVVYTSVPLALTLVILVLSIGMVNRNLKTEPIYLLSTKGE